MLFGGPDPPKIMGALGLGWLGLGLLLLCFLLWPPASMVHAQLALPCPSSSARASSLLPSHVVYLLTEIIYTLLTV